MDALAAFLSRVLYGLGTDHTKPKSELWTLDFELVHKLVLKALLEDRQEFLCEMIPAVQEGRCCLVEPERGLYDLKVVAGEKTYAFEIKVWSPLSQSQIERQVRSASIDNFELFYLLLGKTGADWSRCKIRAETNGKVGKISYNELLNALEPIKETEPLAAAYFHGLLAQRDRIKQQGFGDPDF